MQDLGTPAHLVGFYSGIAEGAFQLTMALSAPVTLRLKAAVGGKAMLVGTLLVRSQLGILCSVSRSLFWVVFLRLDQGLPAGAAKSRGARGERVKHAAQTADTKVSLQMLYGMADETNLT